MSTANLTSKISLEGKVAVISGASRGIGEAIATAMVEAGARVVLASRKIEDLEKVAAKLGERALAVACHTGKPDDVKALYARAVMAFGQVDVLVNNAATNPHFGALLDASDAQIDKTIEVNLKGYFYGAREHVAHLRSRKAVGGAIINIASVAALGAAPMQGVYGMSKAAVVSMTKTLAFELAGQPRVNVICPGLVETKFAAAIVQNDTLRNHVIGRTPLGRHAQPVEIAGAAVFLASDAASYVNGAVFSVDGGMTAS